ncbi:AMP-binding protein [Sphaerisporangium sp. TRM90804]|uniref:AMP-binding protein n=1 Tax=Sphaerisporangium sp. TRM90804 TaxID=3031113 RepID=UPI00244A0464|nr:AMP-binding protein [Sphaerisporangium sp. TRM90804]MDH2430865.1 AMP-binding protein [Sphaerisporangium sp. TRM90804]
MHQTTDTALHARFLRGLARAPHGVAVRAGNDTLTYTEAHEMALDWAGALLGAPGGPPSAVSVLAGRTMTAYIGILSALYAGVPVVPLLADFPAARVRAMLDSAEVSALIVDELGAALLPELDLRGMPVLAPYAGPAPHAPGCTFLTAGPGTRLDRPRGAEPGDVAYVLFTSGSTGRPKGVRLTHGNMAHYFALMDDWYDFTEHDVFSQAANLNWDSAVSDLWCAWGVGAPLVSVPPQAYRDMPGFMAEHGVTVWFSAPSVIALLRRVGGLAPGAMPSLRWTFFGGEALQYGDTDDWQRAAPGSAVINVYGPTEMTITTHRHRWCPEESTRLGVNGVVPLGRLHDGHAELLLDEHGEPSPVEGELWLSGPQLSAGYLDPEDGRGKYLQRDGRRWYRTGDRVRRVDTGELIYLGRVDSQVQVQGYRVELAEVEHALRDGTPVLDAVVVGVPAAGSTELVSFYLGDPVSPQEFHRALTRLLPAQMVPRHYHRLEEFPLNTNKKIDRLRLAAEAARLHGDAAVPAPVRAGQGTGHPVAATAATAGPMVIADATRGR